MSKLDRPLRVGLLVPSFQIGAIELWILQLARYIDPSRIHWTGMALMEWSQEDPHLTAQMSKIMPIYGTPAPPEPNAQHDFTNVQRYGDSSAHGIMQVAVDSDVVLCWGLDTDILNVTLAVYKQRGTKIALLSQSPEAPNGDKNFGTSADICVASCGEAMKAFSNEHQKRCYVIHNGVDLNLVAPTIPYNDLRAEWGIDPRASAIGAFGSAGANDVVKTAKAVKKLAEPYKLVVFSSKSEETREEVESILGKDVVYPKTIPTIGNALSAIQCLVHTGIKPVCFSNNVIEAWLSRTPVVTTPVGIWQEVSTNDQIVEALPQRPSIQNIAMGIENAFSPSFESVVDNAANIAWQRYSSSHCAEQWTSFLEEKAGLSG